MIAVITKHSAVDETGVCQWMRLGRRGRADDAHAK
eukprot:COSAG03_NODE_1901_length_3377_cov_1.333435_2_plen_35_part_00